MYGTDHQYPKIPSSSVAPVNALIQPVQRNVDGLRAVLLKEHLRLPIYLSFRPSHHPLPASTERRFSLASLEHNRKLNINFVEKALRKCEIPLMATSGQASSAEPRTVLIVEDNALNLKLFNDLLEYHGYTTIVTSLGNEAVALARETRPDLILLDIQLPDISGMDVARQLKAEEETRSIPIIAVTAFAMSGDRAKFLASGCDDYLAKPFNVLEFLYLVERYTSRNHGQVPEQVG